MSDTVKARRGTEQKEFSRAAWDLLPKDKYGWHEEVEVPDEIKALQGPVSNAPDPAADVEPEAPAAPSETVSSPAKTSRKGAGK